MYRDSSSSRISFCYRSKSLPDSNSNRRSIYPRYTSATGKIWKMLF
ncbi:hypothetical protein Gotur_023374 [Gossypium turneri]